MINFAPGESKYLSSAVSTSNTLLGTSGNGNVWTVAMWVKWDSNTGATSKFAWVEGITSGSSYVGLRFNNGVVYFSWAGSLSTLHTPTLGVWYLYVFQGHKITDPSITRYVNCWVNNTQVVTDAVTVGSLESVDQLQIGALVVSGIDLKGVDCQICALGGWDNLNLDSDQRTTLYNGGTPDVGKFLVVGSLFYLFEFADNRSIIGPVATLTENGGAPTYTSNAEVWGTAESLATSAVTSIPGCVAFWPFQDGPGVNPVDIVNNYTLTAVDEFPPSVRGGIFGEYGLFFNEDISDHILQIPKASCPALDIYGADAEMSIVTWFRDYANDATCNTLACMWNENVKRQYAQFRAVGDASYRRVVTHICSLSNAGGKSYNDGYPDDIYNHEWAIDGEASWSIDSSIKMAASTYDSLRARSFRDAVYVYQEFGGGIGPRNPYTSGDGGGLSGGPAMANEFSVGSRKLGALEGWGEKWHGIIYGVAVFNRCLTLREIAILKGISAPSTTITTDLTGQTISEIDTIALAATVDKASYTTADTTWTSDLDGVLGTGSSITTTLSPGTHTITASTGLSTTMGVLDEDTLSVTVIAASTGAIPDLSLDRVQHRTSAQLTAESLNVVQPNETYLSLDAPPGNTIYWQIRPKHAAEATMSFITTDSGITPANVANIRFFNKTTLAIELDRTSDYYLRFRIDRGDWSEWSLIELSGEIRLPIGRHRSQTEVTRTSRGYSVRTVNPRWTETKTRRGATIVNNVYTKQPPKSNF